MSERIPCEFHLIRYVPDRVKNEFVNIGVLLREAEVAGDGVRSSRVKFTRDWSRVRCVDPDADVALLESLEVELQQRLTGEPQALMMRTLEESFSNAVQISEGRGCLAESVAEEMEQLMRMYVEPVRGENLKRRSGRAAIAVQMRNEFERAGVWRLMRKRIAAAEYTRAGDPLKIDCGYRPNGVVRMFHAVSLDNDVETAKSLAFTAPRLSEGVMRVEKATLELTAIVEPISSVGADMELYRFGVEILEQQKVRVLTVSDLGRVAETARRELRV